MCLLEGNNFRVCFLPTRQQTPLWGNPEAACSSSSFGSVFETIWQESCKTITGNVDDNDETLQTVFSLEWRTC